MSIFWQFQFRLLTAVFLFVGPAMVVQAQSESLPDTITYTGFLRDSAGDPVSGNKNFTFELFGVASGGTALWTETQNDVPVAAGVFAVDLGSVAPFAGQGLVFDRPLFLAITVDGELMNARLPLTSAPYALRSGEGVSNVSVSCVAANPDDHDSIQEAIDRAPAGGPLIVTIEGVCIENVNLERDRVTFLSATDIEPDVKGGAVPTDGIRGTVDSSSPLRLDGASDIVVRGLVLENAPGDDRYGLFAFDNASVALLNVLLRDSWAGALANNGGFISLFDSKVEGNTNYGLLFSDNGHGRIRNTHIIHHVSTTSAGDEGAIGAFRSGNVRMQGVNRIINGGNDGLFDATNPDAAVNDDNGRSLYPAHGVQMRQDSGNSFIVGEISGSQQVQISLRDPELIGDISLTNNSLMDLRTNSTGGQELSARRIDVSNGSFLSFGRDDTELRVTGPVNVSHHSRVGLFRDSITAEFGQVNVHNFAELHARGSVTINGDVNVGNNSDFNSWQQLNTVSLTNLHLNHQSRGNFRGVITIAGDIHANGNSVVDVYDEDSTSTTSKTVVEVAGRLNVNGGSRLSIHNTAVMNVLQDASFHAHASVDVGGSSQDPSVDNASELNVMGDGGVSMSQRGSLNVNDGARVRAKSLGIGPFGMVNLGDGSHIEVLDGGAPGPIDMFSFNQMFWNEGSRVTGNMNLGTYSIVNVDGPANVLKGGVNVNSGITPGVLNVFGGLDLESGEINCNGQALDAGTVNVGGGAVTFSGGGGFVNCAAP